LKLYRKDIEIFLKHTNEILEQIQMALTKYVKKRQFDSTPEPRGKVSSDNGRIYVVQKHDASKLHYDLRLEINGVLWSWAVPKEPVNDSSVKRLAVKVEDHPVEYATFEGVIPKGNYGAGKVEIWDKGTFEILSLLENKIVIKILGEKLGGKFALIRMPRIGRNSWLFFKTKDD
jgi:DNA ligase D-like protein (predicted 3'-phosphoesterase)